MPTATSQLTYRLESNPVNSPVRYTDMGEKVYMTVQVFRSATELLRARGTVTGESRVTVRKVGM
jgi:hypothetical protein